ncbi:protein translocase subunit SecD [Oleiagrimonas soli]|uniref:Protein translocase subunit SecD n=1 Tax=Oleiagrimonas soli TaxID=1543381 RepID=A0A099CYL1_9GAMM|nr:protein translocase subunit SecD [Oleiagrimonas soli]KGI78702.1 preprotein translocase subunit SecD [Oleiagrimonas soli]MBB6183968.1 preprotein translocase subunit SecD [Oleiagrimonas soli]
MSDFPRWKYALVVVVLLLGLLYALPNVFPPQPAVQISANRGAQIDASMKDKVESILKQHQLTWDKIAISGDAQQGSKRLLVRFKSDDVQAKAVDALKNGMGDQYVVAPNLASTVPSWLRAIHANSMPLGLDLQGGVHFLMQVDQSGVRQRQEQVYVGNVRQLLREKNIRYVSVSHSGNGVVAVLRSDADRSAAMDAIGTEYPDLNISNGPSTSNRFVLNMQIKPDKLRELAQNTIRQNLSTLRNRVNALGVSEPLVQQQGNSRIVVDLAGIQDTAEAKRILGAQASLEYRAGIAMYPDQRVVDAEQKGIVPPDARLYYGKACPQGCLLSKQIIVTGDELTNANSGFDQQQGSPEVQVTLNAAGAKSMRTFTESNVGKPMAVVYIDHIPQTKMVDGKEEHSFKTSERVISYATVNGVFGRQFSTTGLDSPKEASDLALLLKAGSLAAPMTFVEQHVIGPSLGRDNIRKGVSAVILGLSLVLLAALIYYKLFGLVADIALVLNLVLLVAVMSMIGVTLTMPGIAGIVLTLGMAIDSNVLICERVREELRNGSTPHASIRAGYEKAWATILDANVTHLLAAMALMTMGSGPIRGFGVTLFIGILTSMFTSVTVTHAITALIHGRRKLKTLSV